MVSAQETLRRQQFAKKLQYALVARGWTQSELARRMQMQLPPDAQGEVRRDLVSRYLKAIHLPGPIYLKAMADALKMEPDDLLPPEDPSSLDATVRFRFTDLGDGKVQLQINQVLPYAVALKIAALLEDAQSD